MTTGPEELWIGSERTPAAVIFHRNEDGTITARVSAGAMSHQDLIVHLRRIADYMEKTGATKGHHSADAVAKILPDWRNN